MSISSRLPMQGAKLLASGIVALAVSGCGGGTASPSEAVSAAPSATLTASPSAVPSPTPISSASPRPNGVFSTTGSMVVQTDDATTTLLADGRVLVTGGGVGGGDLSSAEIYDPATGKWTKTGSMVKGHSNQTATLLKDGRVLIVGGCDIHTTAEMYDPATGKFSRLGKVDIDGTCHSTATLLHDGRVLIAGGYGDGDSKLAELFDPATGKFTRTGSLHTARSYAQAALLPDGRVLVVGGDQADGTANEVELDSSEIYDPATGKFSDAAKMETPRTYLSATPLANGKVLVAGGVYNDPSAGVRYLDSAELYDPTTDKFSPTGSMTVHRINPTDSVEWGNLCTSTLADGRVLFVGGTVDPEKTTAEIYDPAAGKFSATTTPSKDQIPYGLPAVTLKDGRVLFPGAPSLLYTP